MTVILAGSSENIITIGYNISAETAVLGSDYETTSGTLTFDPGVSSQVIKIPLIDNSVNEGDETLSVILSNVSNGVPGSPIVAQLVIKDDDPLPIANLTTTSQNVNENDGEVTLTVQLNTVSDQTVEVEYITTTQAVALGSNNQTGGKLTFAPGEQSQSFQIPISDDSLDEPDEYLVVRLVNPTNATIGTQGSTEIIIMDDDSPVSIAFTAENYSQNEDGGTVEIEVLLSAVSGHVVTVNVATADLTATAGSDYVALNEILTFPAGEISQTITVQLLDDDESENSEELSLTLSAANHALLVTPDVAILTLIDNDGATIFMPMIFRSP